MDLSEPTTGIDLTRPSRIKLGIPSKVNNVEQHGNVLLISIKKPTDFIYRAGQYVNLRVPTLKDRGESERAHAMSIASSPNEEGLLFAMQLSESPFKQAVSKMKLGDDIELDGPLGYFFMHDTFEPTIFLAGGIGIVPFRSFLLEEQAQGWPHSIMLFYSVGQIKNAAFLEELSDMQNEKFKIILTLTHSQESWPVVTNEKGRISGEMINKHVPNLSSHYCYIVGSPIMVSDIYYQLNELGVDPRKIVTEPFTGY